jgi:hypothetical protein
MREGRSKGLGDTWEGGASVASRVVIVDRVRLDGAARREYYRLLIVNK